MSNKTEIILSVYEEQAKKYEKISSQRFQDSMEHKGAETALRLMEKQIAAMAGAIENEISDSKELKGETARQVLIWSKRVIADIALECHRNAENQHNMSYRSRGQFEQAKMMADDLRRQALAKKAFADNREVIADGARASKSTKANGTKANGTKAKAKGTKAKSTKANGTKTKSTKAKSTKANGVKARKKPSARQKPTPRGRAKR